MLLKNRVDELNLLEDSLKYTFTNKPLLNKALTHKSYVNEKNPGLKNNERLEFLGDSVLDLIVSNYLVANHVDLNEGTLSKIRAAVVNESCLAKLARNFDLGKYLLLGKGEQLSGGRDKASLLANTFEAVVGAIYLDSNFETVCQVLLPAMEGEIIQYVDKRQFRDFKSELQEWTQNKFDSTPSYQVTRESGPDHEKLFEVAVLIQNKPFGTGTGRSKKEAEQASAKMALDKIS